MVGKVVCLSDVKFANGNWGVMFIEKEGERISSESSEVVDSEGDKEVVGVVDFVDDCCAWFVVSSTAMEFVPD